MKELSSGPMLNAYPDSIGGQLADIVAFDRSPLEDIQVMNQVSFVMKDGVVCKKDGVPCVTLQ